MYLACLTFLKIKSVKSKTNRIANSAQIAKGKSPPGLVEHQSQPRIPRKAKASAIKSAPEPRYISVDQSRAITAARSNVLDVVKSAWPDSDEDKVTRSRTIDYDRSAHWTRLSSCHTLDIYKFFDRQVSFLTIGFKNSILTFVSAERLLAS